LAGIGWWEENLECGTMQEERQSSSMLLDSVVSEITKPVKGYVAQIPRIRGCWGEGRTPEKAQQAAKEKAVQMLTETQAEEVITQMGKSHIVEIQPENHSEVLSAVITEELEGQKVVGYFCEVPAIDGCFSCGDSWGESIANIKESAELAFDNPQTSIFHPMGKAHIEPIHIPELQIASTTALAS